MSGKSGGSVKIDGVTLTMGNSKLGRVMNVSLPPPCSCDTSMPCYWTKQCYAMKHAYLPYRNVRDAWDGNWRTLVAGGAFTYFGAIKKAIAQKKPALFRWHVGGDIREYASIYGEGSDDGGAYIGGMCGVADSFPDTKFWCFTKRYAFVRANAKMIKGTPNLTVILSAWPGVKLDGRTRRAWPVCYVDDPKQPDPRIPADAVACPGNCEKCQACVNLKPGQSVKIVKH